MSDYMKEAERLIEDYGNAEWKVGRMSEHSDDAEEIVTRENARADLLAHIQRGAVPEGERAAFESWSENEAGAGAARRWLNTEAYENGRVQDYRTGWIACLEWLAAAPAPGDCPNCFEGKSDMDHTCRACGGSGKAAAPAEVPMPECYVASGGRDLFSEEQMRAFRAAGEAAGYVRGLRDAGHLPNPLDPANGWPQVRIITSGTTAAPDEKTIVALRGEVK